uniref:Uncharacterized protein n=1 Tax=Rhizophora mucronata TaxID=61149 RepID=A0A2P2QNI2_RHIMU
MKFTCKLQCAAANPQLQNFPRAFKKRLLPAGSLPIPRIDENENSRKPRHISGFQFLILRIGSSGADNGWLRFVI